MSLMDKSSWNSVWQVGSDWLTWAFLGLFIFLNSFQFSRISFYSAFPRSFSHKCSSHLILFPYFSVTLSCAVILPDKDHIGAKFQRFTQDFRNQEFSCTGFGNYFPFSLSNTIFTLENNNTNRKFKKTCFFKQFKSQNV